MDTLINPFDSQETLIFLNERLPLEQQQILKKAALQKGLKNFIWIVSSGTESQKNGQTKLIALDKQAILFAAQSIVDFYSIQTTDVILNGLPIFHIGGISQYARTKLSGCSQVLYQKKWDAQHFADVMNREQVTITSLVPTQIYDLLNQKLKPSSSLRLVFVGGGAIDESLFERATQAGWPLVQTYGMTETCAMLAYRTSSRKKWQKFPHIEAWQSGSDQRLSFKSRSLLTGYLFVSQAGETQWFEPVEKGWYQSDDRGIIDAEGLQLIGRESEFVKIKGESVSLLEMNQKWNNYIGVTTQKYLIAALADERDGHELILITNGDYTTAQIVDFNQRQMPFARIRKVYSVTDWPMTELGKLRRAQLLESLMTIQPHLI